GADDRELAQRTADVRTAYREALDDDLNLPQGVGLAFDHLREANAALDAGRFGPLNRTALLGLIDDVDAHLDVIRADDPGLADQDELGSRVADDLLALDVVRLIEPRHTRARSQLLFVEDLQPALVVVVPMSVAISALDHAGDSPRVVVVHRGLLSRREPPEHQGQAVGICLQHG